MYPHPHYGGEMADEQRNCRMEGKGRYGKLTFDSATFFYSQPMRQIRRLSALRHLSEVACAISLVMDRRAGLVGAKVGAVTRSRDTELEDSGETEYKISAGISQSERKSHWLG